MVKVGFNPIPNIKHENQRNKKYTKQKVQKKIYFDNIWKQKHEIKWTRCKIIFHIDVEHIEGNGGS